MNSLWDLKNFDTWTWNFRKRLHKGTEMVDFREKLWFWVAGMQEVWVALRGQPGKAGGSGQGAPSIPGLQGHLFQLQCMHLSKLFGNGVYGFVLLSVKWDFLWFNLSCGLGFCGVDTPQAPPTARSPVMCPLLKTRHRQVFGNLASGDPSITFMTLDNSFNSSEPQYFHLKDRK